MRRWLNWQQHHNGLAARLLAGLLAIALLGSCGGASGTQTGTPTPRATATTTTLPLPTSTPGATPSPGITETPGITVTPESTPGLTPTLRPSPVASPCDPPPGVQPVSSEEIDIGNTARPRIALTFDAGGPSAPTSSILDILAKHHVHVTFFVTGDWANANPGLVRRIYSEGHEIGNHTMHHPDLRTLTDEQVCSELDQADQVISNITSVTTRPYYRPPYGSRDTRVRSLAAHIGYRTVYWTIDTLDWQTTATPASITSIVMNNIRNGAIILMHAGSQVESETLDGLMTKIEQQGYQIVSVSEVLQ